MGWWKIKNVESGGIDWDHKSEGLVLVNATPDYTHTEQYVNGDGPADIMHLAIELIEEMLYDQEQVLITNDDVQQVLRPIFFEGTGYQNSQPIQLEWEQYKENVQHLTDIQEIVALCWNMIRQEYRENWNRDPYPEELQAVFNFVAKKC